MVKLLFFRLGERKFFRGLEVVNGLFRRDDAASKAFLYLLAGRFSHLGALFRDTGILGKSLRVALFVQLRGGFFGQGIEQKFHICHIVAQVFFCKALVAFVFPR